MSIMNSNSFRSDDDNEPITKKFKPDENDDSCDTALKGKNNEENTDLTDNEDEETLLSNDKQCDDDGDDADSSFPFPPDTDVADMLHGITCSSLFPTITERYFTPYYKLNVQSPRDDICILMHSNRICIIALAKSHSALQDDKQITTVDFKVSQKLDRVQNKVSGKSKHGAQPLQANSNICIITCSNGKKYTIKCCIIGKLVEVNEALLQNPKLLLGPPHKGGYLAIVLPNIKLLEKIKESLLTQEQYDLMMLERHRNIMNQQSETPSNVQNICMAEC